MNLTKKEQTEVSEVYETWLNSYLNGDVKTYDSYFDDRYRFIGSTSNEDFLNRKDTTRFFEVTADQLAGKVEIRNSRRTFEKFDELIFITDLFDAYFLNGNNWEYYEKFRFTSILKKTNDDWRFVYQHFSTPDSKAQEGETIGTEQIAAENLMLREAVKRRTIELENKTSELEIETALEKVRSRTMGMQSSDELPEVANLLFLEIQALGIPAWSAGYCIWNEEKSAATAFMSSEGVIQKPFSLPAVGVGYNFQDPLQNGEPFHVSELGGEEIAKHYEFMRTLPVFGEVIDGIIEAGFPLPTFQIFHIVYFPQGYLMFITYEKVPESHNIFKRFTNVFEQTYTRFLDLQKAEAQARESQIQLALERVRARTMAMQHSDELADASFVLDSQVRSLGIKTRGCAFNIYNDNESTEWFSSEAGTMPTYKTPRENIFLRYYKAGQSGKIMHIEEFEGETCINHYDYLCTLPVMGDALRKMKESGGSFPLRQIDHVIYFKYGYLLFITLEHVPEAHDIFLRFAKVFEQTYTRFLDLQNAEVQAREAQIEAALERVRSRSMAMHKTDELQEVVRVVAEELKNTGVILDTWGAVICTYFQDSKDVLHWTASENPANPSIAFLLPYFKDELFDEAWASKNRGDDYFAKVFSYDVKNAFFNYAFEHSDYRQLPDEYKKIILESKSHGLAWAWSKNSAIMIPSIQGDLPSEDEKEILVRFAKVFEQSFIRFLDLKKAEAQAREAQIEAALERVRSRSLAMHQTSELQSVIHSVHQELIKLNLSISGGSFIAINSDINNEIHCWGSGGTADTSDEVHIPRFEKPFYTNLINGIKNGPGFFTEAYTQQEKIEFFTFLFEHEPWSNLDTKQKEETLSSPGGYTRSCSVSKHSSIFIINHFGEKFSEAENDILKRIGKVFEQSYTRFLDLQKAEAQAREAIKQASLDRVRGEIASMRTKDDLNRITPLIWKELNTLEVPFIRCGVFIMNEEKRVIQTYLSTPYGKSLTAFEMAYDLEGVAVGAVFHWNKKEIYQDHWDKKQFVDFMQNLVKTGQIKNAESFQGTSAPPESLHLSFVPFKQGMLYVGNTSPLDLAELQLVKALAESFSIAYARYEDFSQLEEAKNQIEKTFTELKAAQAQLIQAEKMASLGELTAGIAHEIQNPLNFVNNFSEINKELIGELKEELAVGNRQSAEEIADDIKENEEKINHHGKRAADIVKGMLQHSRTSSGQKEPTDINALADEYLRLAYHGLRAKDKSFNADFKTEFDESLPKINVIPQDMGRVLLNLISNAFYAVDKKTKDLPPPPSRSEFGTGSKGGAKNDQNMYRPTVTICTTSSKSPSGDSRLNDTVGQVGVEIRVKDNGPGIPLEIKDKIFQPFFTTKPTGQGTGLGLSLAYDIVKAHGGELKVETKEGEGSEFIILLPV